jgi:predicted LPLAT superfamily acyltransferase
MVCVPRCSVNIEPLSQILQRHCYSSDDAATAAAATATFNQTPVVISTYDTRPVTVFFNLRVDANSLYQQGVDASG